MLYIRTDPDVCPDPMFSRAKRLSRPADPDKVSPGPLARILGFPNFAVSAKEMVQIMGQQAKEPAALSSH